MKTIVVSIGNSDNKLSQIEWSVFVNKVATAISHYAKQIHFFGGAPNWERWQNVAWMFDCLEADISFLKLSLAVLCNDYNQDSIAYLEGETVFIQPEHKSDEPLPVPTVTELPAKLRELRKFNKWKLIDVAQMTSLSPSFLSDVERGVTSPSFETLQKLADVYCVPITFQVVPVVGEPKEEN